MAPSKNDSVIIVGAGAFGLSTALELSNRGYTNISVFERDEEIPSRWSAANDLNKIARAEYEDDYYTDLAVEAMDVWQTPLFAPYFHRVGFLNVVSGKGPQQAIDTMKRFQAAAERHPAMKRHVSNVETREDIKDICWQIDGETPGWKGYFNKYDGYVHSGNALIGVYKAVRSQGVKFFLGRNNGAIKEVVYENTPQGRKATGVRTEGGRIHTASLVIVAVGAAGTKIVPEIGSQVVAKSWSVAHVHLTDEETAALRGIPVIYARDLGFFFEPDPATNLLKLCPMGGGYINTNKQTGISQPPESLAQSSFLPAHDEKKLRELLRQTLPSLADRPFVRKTLCWFADTSDSDFIIDYVPKTSSSVIFMSGDSGHGFKMFPIVGRWVNDLLNNGQQQVTKWRWREPKQSNPLDTTKEDVSWRLGSEQELSEILPAATPARL